MTWGSFYKGIRPDGSLDTEFFIEQLVHNINYLSVHDTREAAEGSGAGDQPESVTLSDADLGLYFLDALSYDKRLDNRLRVTSSDPVQHGGPGNDYLSVLASETTELPGVRYELRGDSGNDYFGTGHRAGLYLSGNRKS